MEFGWTMAIETTNGIVGLWTCWLGDRFKLCYPLNVNIPDEVIMETLNVTLAKPVANDLFGTRLWAKYYSEKLDDCGRVWIAQESNHSCGYSVKTIRNEQIEEHACGHNYTNTVATYDFHFCTETEPEAPNCLEENIQPYKEKFIQLLVKIAKLVGDITAVNLDSGLLSHDPGMLNVMGYVVKISLDNGLALYTPEMINAKGDVVKISREGETVYCYTQKDNFEIVLENENPKESWSTVIRFSASNELTAESLIKLLESFDN